jgi:hypothetical protein
VLVVPAEPAEPAVLAGLPLEPSVSPSESAAVFDEVAELLLLVDG